MWRYINISLGEIRLDKIFHPLLYTSGVAIGGPKDWPCRLPVLTWGSRVTSKSGRTSRISASKGSETFIIHLLNTFHACWVISTFSPRWQTRKTVDYQLGWFFLFSFFFVVIVLNIYLSLYCTLPLHYVSERLSCYAES